MSRLATWGNELYAGKKSYPFVQKWKTWFTVALILLAIAGGLLLCAVVSTWALISEVVLSSLCQASRIRIPYSVKRLFPKWFRKPKRQQQILLAAPYAFRQQNCRMNRLLRLPRIYNRDTTSPLSK